jgi:hypothetical protein
MVYMAGNNSLSDAAGVDLQEMRKVGSTDEVQICAFVKRDDGKGAQRLVVRRDGRGETIDDLGDLDSGDPQTVVDFARWAVDQAPAERYALVLWNHGGGWRAGDLQQLYSQVRGEQAARSRDGRSEINVRAGQGVGRALFSTTVRQIISLPTRAQRDICADDGTGHSLDTIELGRVCRALAKELGRPLDLLGMDACLMSNLEVAYEVRASVQHIVGSEDVEPGAGWPYQTILAALNKQPAMDGEALAQAVVKRYVESYKDDKGNWPVTQSAVATGGVETLSAALDELSGALRAEIDSGWPQLMSAQSNAVRFQFDLLDLATLCDGLAHSTLSDATKSAAARVKASLKPDGYLLAEGHLGDDVEGCAGVSTYLPAPTDTISPYYKDLVFAKRHHWDELLHEYGHAVSGG